MDCLRLFVPLSNSQTCLCKGPLLLRKGDGHHSLRPCASRHIATHYPTAMSEYVITKKIQSYFEGESGVLADGFDWEDLQTSVSSHISISSKRPCLACQVTTEAAHVAMGQGLRGWVLISNASSWIRAWQSASTERNGTGHTEQSLTAHEACAAHQG